LAISSRSANQSFYRPTATELIKFWAIAHGASQRRKQQTNSDADRIILSWPRTGRTELKRLSVAARTNAMKCAIVVTAALLASELAASFKKH
jgi:hypothetical protein